VREFDYVRPADVREAVAAVSAYPASAYLAGGTTQVDLMLKDGILDVERLVDITRLPLRGIRREGDPGKTMRGYDRPVSHAAALVDEIANELDTWPGVHIERLSEHAALVRYQELELGVLDRDRGMAELRFARLEHDELVEHGDASPADSMPDPEVVSHSVEGPSDVTGVLELFDRRYREVRGEEYPDSVE
jgi:FAD binding domain in molybdopterin dehydrogenase/Family of unknown function (DUF5519)